MNHSLSGSERNKKIIRLVLTPSWLSGLLVVTTSVALVGGTIILSGTQKSSIWLDFLKYRTFNVSNNYQAVDSGLQANKLIANLPLLILWGLVGLLVYLFVTNIFNSVRNAAGMIQGLDYVHADRRQLIWNAVQKLGMRIVVLALWVPFIMFFFHHMVPTSIARALAGSAQLATVQGLEYALSALLIMLVGFHVHTILARLFFLRPRVFSSALYI